MIALDDWAGDALGRVPNPMDHFELFFWQNANCAFGRSLTIVIASGLVMSSRCYL
jgi:hypothetical protein